MQITTIQAQPSHYAALADLFEGVFVGEGYAPASSRDRLRDITKVVEAGFLPETMYLTFFVQVPAGGLA